MFAKQSVDSSSYDSEDNHHSFEQEHAESEFSNSLENSDSDKSSQIRELDVIIEKDILKHDTPELQQLLKDMQESLKTASERL